MTDKKLTELTALVVEQSAQLSGAIQSERSTSSDLLRAVVESIRPALRALSSRLEDGSLPLRGCVLIRCATDDKPCVSLVLMEDGGFLRLTGPRDNGSWSWTDLTDAEVVREYALSECTEAIRTKLEEYARGNAGRTAKKALDKAERLRAITVLLKQ